jgi:hypothetical protein
MAETTTHKRHKFILIYDEPWAQLTVFQGFFDGWVAADPKHNTKKKFGQMLDVSGDTIRRMYEGGMPVPGGVRPCRPTNDAICQIAGIFSADPEQFGWVNDGRQTLPEVEAEKPTMPLGVDLEDQDLAVGFKVNPPITEFYQIPITEFAGWGKKIAEREQLHWWWAKNLDALPVMVTVGSRDPHITTVELPCGLPKFYRMQMATAMVTGIIRDRKPMAAHDAVNLITQLHLRFAQDMLPAEAAVAGQQDLLGPARGILQGLHQLNDELKILVVDSEDVAEGSKDPRTGFLAKRLKTLRKTNQDLLVKLSGK